MKAVSEQDASLCLPAPVGLIFRLDLTLALNRPQTNKAVGISGPIWYFQAGVINS